VWPTQMQTRIGLWSLLSKRRQDNDNDNEDDEEDDDEEEEDEKVQQAYRTRISFFLFAFFPFSTVLTCCGGGLP